MKIQDECIPCLFKRIIFEANHSTKDKKKKDNALKAAALAFSKIYSQDTCSAEIATKVHKATYQALQDNDPYKKLKCESNTIALSLLPKINKILGKSNNRLETSILCSIVGNALDFGIDGGSTHPAILIDQFQHLFHQGFGYNDLQKVENILKKSNNILYFTDNCGEIVFDKIVCEEIKKQYPTIRITVVVKETPILSDATMDDATLIKFSNVVDSIITTGCYAVGLDHHNISKQLKRKLEKNDLIICKGMANYEVFSETDYRPIAYFLRSKCRPIAESMGIDKDKNIVKLYQ